LILFTVARWQDFCDLDVTCFRHTEWNTVGAWCRFVYSSLVGCSVCWETFIKCERCHMTNRKYTILSKQHLQVMHTTHASYVLCYRRKASDHLLPCAVGQSLLLVV